MGSQHRRYGHRRFLCPTGEDEEADDGQRGREREVQIGKLEGPHTPGREQSLETGQTIPTPPVLRGLLRGPDGYYIGACERTMSEARQKAKAGHVRRQGPRRKSPRGFQAFLPWRIRGSRAHPRRSPRVVHPRCSVGFSRRRAINRTDLISIVEAVCKIDKQISTGSPLPSWREWVVVHETSGTQAVDLGVLDVEVGCGVVSQAGVLLSLSGSRLLGSGTGK